MRTLAALALLSMAGSAAAATAYVTDQLVLNVYSELNQQGRKLATLHSGASVETLGTSADFTQIRLPDGTTGWVRTSYLTSEEPATVRVKRLQEELDRTRATTPELAEAAERNEADQLRQALAAKQAELDAARSSRAGPQPAAGRASRGAFGALVIACALAAAGAGGFWLGYVTLARRVKRKFGGLKVY